ncbi:MAG: PqqD family peptide modification chaperone [Microthrixaceae bacterium]|nr:PqqD family peptide modification chaperone [Microthrixaceae bacterium]
MPTFPRRSTGVLLSIMGDRALAYDLVTETAHQMNASAGMVLAACDGESDIGGAVRVWAEEYGIEPDGLRDDVNAGLEMLNALSLVGRDGDFVAPREPTGSTSAGDPGDALGAVHVAIDHKIAFRGPQSDILERIDSYMGTARSDQSASIVFDVQVDVSGEVSLVADQVWRFLSFQACLDQLTSVMNRYAVQTHSCAAFHAGAVRSPAGEVALLPGPSGAGKSTLTAAFVVAGWDYLGDEAIGVRPGSCIAVGYPKRIAINNDRRLALDLSPDYQADIDPADLRSNVARLDGDVGPVSRVLLPTYVEAATPSSHQLTSDEAVVELLANTLNLARAGQTGLDAVVDLATSVPVYRLTYGDASQAVDHVATHPT